VKSGIEPGNVAVAGLTVYFRAYVSAVLRVFKPFLSTFRHLLFGAFALLLRDSYGTGRNFFGLKVDGSH
jgi:hypothetical protein